MSPRVIAYPYRRIQGEEVLHLGGWLCAAGGGAPGPVNGEIQGWDYRLDIELSRSFSLDASLVLEQLGFAPGEAAVELLITCSSGTRGPRWIGYRTGGVREGPVSGTASIPIPSREVSRRLRLTTELILADAPAARRDPLSPAHPGSRLFEQVDEIMLEGSSDRFPMEPLDFQKSPWGLDPGALWYLQWRPDDLHLHFSAAVTLFLNSASEELLERAATDPMIQRLMGADVARQLCLGALLQEDFLDDGTEYEEGTIGHVISHILSLAFPDQSRRKCSELMRRDPGRFAATIQATFP